MSEIIPFSKTGQAWSTEDHKKHSQTISQYAAGAIDRDACIAQMRAMLGMTDQPKAAPVVIERPSCTNADLAPIYAPDPFENTAEYIAVCRAHGMAVHRTVLECARDAEQAAQVAERRDVWEVQA